LPEGVKVAPEAIFFSYPFRRFKHSLKEPLIESPVAYITPFARPFCDINIYDIEPKLAKKAVPITGKVRLKEDGSNIAIVLSHLLRNRKKEKKFYNLMKEYLPFIEKADIDKIADKSLLLKFKEKYFQNMYLPASLISDGTIRVAALIIALYFENIGPSEPAALKIIEEPERNIHPYLISKLINMMKDASELNQIISTTHNPEIVKYADLDDILLISRDKEGYSTIFRPTEKKEIKTFLENDIGVEELYVQNLLSI